MDRPGLPLEADEISVLKELKSHLERVPGTGELPTEEADEALWRVIKKIEAL